MFKVFSKSTLLIFTIYMTLNTADAQKKIPLKNFFKNPPKTGYQISPEGNYYSYLGPYKKRMNLFVQGINSKKATRITSITDRDLSSYFWKSESRLVYFKDSAGDENFHIYAIDADGSNIKDLTPFSGVRAGLVNILEDNEEEMLIQLNKDKKEVFDVYRLNLKSGSLIKIATNPGNIIGWVTDHNDKLRIAVTADGVNTSLLYRETEEDAFKVVLTTNFKESLSPLFFDFDNKNLFVSSNIGRDKEAIVKIDPKTGKELSVIFEHPDVDAGNLSYSRKRKVLLSVSFTTWKKQRKFMDAETEKLFKNLESKLGSYEIAITSVTRDENTFIVRTYSDRSLGSYYLYDLSKDKLTLITEVSPWLKEKQLAKMEPISFKSRDGLLINGYLTMPNVKNKKDLPVVINPHGGPWARDNWGFNPEVQFLANRGYAVLQINFRGSVGYGRKFKEASFKQWGRDMQNDITDGVKWLVQEGIADSNRIAIYGGSYGGYATLAGITFTPDLYACAIDYVGVSNLLSFMKTIPPYWKPYLEMMYEMVGNPETETEMLKAASPVFHVDKIVTPLFVAQGAMDPRVNKAESDQIVDALQKRGIEVEYMVKEDEGHGFRNEENQFEFYKAMEKFLKKHMK
ncbi:MAG: S9 family peptidase [Flavobacteriales bacterium]|nr:S9 family peptidase [Flavobacteriales bacterium]